MPLPMGMSRDVGDLLLLLLLLVVTVRVSFFPDSVCGEDDDDEDGFAGA